MNFYKKNNVKKTLTMQEVFVKNIYSLFFKGVGIVLVVPFLLSIISGLFFSYSSYSSSFLVDEIISTTNRQIRLSSFGLKFYLFFFLFLIFSMVFSWFLTSRLTRKKGSVSTLKKYYFWNSSIQGLFIFSLIFPFTFTFGKSDYLEKQWIMSVFFMSALIPLFILFIIKKFVFSSVFTQNVGNFLMKIFVFISIFYIPLFILAIIFGGFYSGILFVIIVIFPFIFALVSFYRMKNSSYLIKISQGLISEEEIRKEEILLANNLVVSYSQMVRTILYIFLRFRK